jgi:hypothetical protein
MWKKLYLRKVRGTSVAAGPSGGQHQSSNVVFGSLEEQDANENRYADVK